MRNGRVRKCFVFIITAILIFSVGCGGEELPPPVEVDLSSYYWMDNSYTDSSQLPDWDETQLNLTAWNANQTGNFAKYDSESDVVSPEIARVTGVTISETFDNKGSSVSTRLQQLFTTKTIPHIAYGTFEMSEVIDPNDVYDLTELIDKYCPTIKARMPASVWSQSHINGGVDGKVYAIPFGSGNVSLTEVDPDADPMKVKAFQFQNDYYGYVNVRDDILADLRALKPEKYPGLRTWQEIEAIYDVNGEFTEAELFDAGIESADDFYKFLYDINDVIKAYPEKYSLPKGRRVMPILAQDGMKRDTWSPMAILWGRLMNAAGPLNTMFAYWDKPSQQVDIMVNQPFFKEFLYDWTRFVEEGEIMDTYGYNNDYTVLQSEINKGYYAVTYENATAGNDVAYDDNGNVINYRKVYMKIPKAPQFEFFVQSAPQPSSIVIFKKTQYGGIEEGYVEQVLRYLDFQASQLGDKLFGWGPETAGLFTEDQNGVRAFKNEALANQMVYNRSTLGSEVRKYNLLNGLSDPAQTVFPFFYNGGSKDHPAAVYDLSNDKSRIKQEFTPSAVVPMPFVPIARRADMHTWTNVDLPGVQQVWAKRESIEKALKQIIIGGTANFDARYQAMQNALQNAGWTSAYFNGAYTDAFLRLNKDYLSGFYTGTRTIA